MTVKPRTPGQTAISISLPSTLLEDIDRRAGALGLNRSQYLAALARIDVESKGELTLREAPPEYHGEVEKQLRLPIKRGKRKE